MKKESRTNTTVVIPLPAATGNMLKSSLPLSPEPSLAHRPTSSHSSFNKPGRSFPSRARPPEFIRIRYARKKERENETHSEMNSSRELHNPFPGFSSPAPSSPPSGGQTSHAPLLTVIIIRQQPLAAIPLMKDLAERERETRSNSPSLPLPWLKSLTGSFRYSGEDLVALCVYVTRELGARVNPRARRPG